MSASNFLIEKINGFARKFYLNRLIQGVLIGLVLLIVYFLLLNGLEYFSWFSSRGRFILFVLLILGGLAVVISFFFVPLVNLLLFRKKMPVKQASVLIGRFFPDIKDKLLNTIQLSENFQSDTQNELLAATIQQRTDRLSPVRFTDAIDLRVNYKYLAILLGFLVLLVVLFLFWPEGTVKPAKRIINYQESFEKPLPFSVTLPYDTIQVTQGKDVTFSIHVVGQRIPDDFHVKSDLGQQMMNKTSANDFEYVFKNVFSDISFEVVGGDYVSKTLKIIVHPTPTLLSYSCDLHYPPYVHRPNETLDGKTRLIVPQGTIIDFHFATRDSDNAFVLADSTRYSLKSQDGVYSYSYISDHSSAFDLLVLNQWKQDADPLSFHIDVLPDAYPEIRMESYDESLSSDVYYSGLIADDYGFTKLTFNCLIKQPQPRTIVLPVSFDRSLSRTSFFYRFNMDSLGIQPGQNLEVFFEVWDNDAYHGPKSTRSETFTYYKPSAETLDSIAGKNEEKIISDLSKQSKEATSLQEQIERLLEDLTSKKELDWSDKEKIKDLVNKQNEVQKEWNRLQEEQKQVSDFMKKNDLQNEELLKKQDQINKLFDEVIPDEMKKMMAEIQKMLDQMPRETLQQMMQDMKNDNKNLQELMDRNLSLLEQLKMEQDLNALIDKLDKLGEELKNSNPDSASTKKASTALDEFNKLMDELNKLEKKNDSLTDPFDIDKDEELEQDIQQDLNDASDSEQSDSPQQQQKSNSKKQDAGKKMQKMANGMSMMMKSGDQQQMAEDAHLTRILLENVIRASHQQEALLVAIGKLRVDDPSIAEKIATQKELSDNFAMVRDSLKAMAIRQSMIQNFIFDELNKIDTQTALALKNLNALHLSAAVANQQSALMSMNNLALMLAESLDNMQNSMDAAGQASPNAKPKPGKDQGLKNMQQMQEHLGKQLKQMQQDMQKPGVKNQSNMSEQLARMAAEQQMLREGMQQMLDEMKKNGQTGDDGLNDIIKDMEKLEEDIVNKRITNQTLERNRDILSRMLEAQNAQQKRDQDEKRKSNEFKGSEFDRKIDPLIFQQSVKRSQEFLNKTPIEYLPYYNDKVNQYYLRKNSH